ncbi:Enolase-phosphatase E1 [Eumeta japonica]|uniref:Enolase-phosphatase E1 n=1 Tax=Eumeta variegata TaxID=151549 RepID=A0A4C1SPZ6_EUMVA|nr:Enolase-phosphatase E1 [Eumeta japonica]
MHDPTLCAAAVSLLLGRIGQWSEREIARSALCSHARLRRNATMSHALSLPHRLTVWPRRRRCWPAIFALRAPCDRDANNLIFRIEFDKLFPYAEEHVKQFLTEKWESDDVKKAVAALRSLAVQDQEASVDGVVSIPEENASKDEQIEALVNSVKWQMSLDRKNSALKLLQGLIWKQGYDSGDIKGHVYDDVPAALENWHSIDGRKVYIYSSGSVQAQQLLFGQSSAGDLRSRIDGHFDTAVGAKQEASSYTAISEKIGCKPDEILFLTDIEKEAEAAKAAGLYAVLVSREGNAPLAESAAAYPLIHSLAQLVVTNKRKQDTDIQEENPAKVAKTTKQDDIKISSTEEQTLNAGDAPESMEVETELAEVKELTDIKEAEVQKVTDDKEAELKKPTDDTEAEVKKPTDVNQEAEVKPGKMQVETVVEEIMDSDDKIDVPMIEVEPVVIEGQPADTPIDVLKKVDTPETAEAVSTVDAAELTNGQPNKETEEIKTLVLTEIEEIDSDKPIVDDVAEIIEDLEPIVEEPDMETAGVGDADLDNLKNVGQVLEKECDEILSKVHDVTNLDSITIKPMLNVITEENTETDITDSDDIVDRILDTELEFDMKSVDANGDTPASQTQDSDDKAAKVESSEKEIELSVVNVEPSVANVESSVTDIKQVVDGKPLATDVQPSLTEVESSVTDVEVSVLDTKPSSTDADPSPTVVEPSATDVDMSSVDGEEVTSTGNDEKSAPAQSNPEPVSEDKITITNKEESNATNGDIAPTTLNGDDVSSRLAIENGAQSTDAALNGADSTEASLNGAGDVSGAPSADAVQSDPTSTDIKVKSVPTEETHTDPTDQTTEA